MTSLSSRQVALFVLIFISLASSAIAMDMLHYGSKVREHDIDEGRSLSQFYIAPEFAFLDLNGNGIPDPDEPVYIHIDPTISRVSENDLRITSFGDNSSPVTFFPAGSKVKATEPDHDKELRKFGAWHTPAAELRYFDVNGDKAYSIDDPVYLEFNHGFVTAGDVRIDGYDNCSPGSRVRAQTLIAISQRQLFQECFASTMPMEISTMRDGPFIALKIQSTWIHNIHSIQSRRMISG